MLNEDVSDVYIIPEDKTEIGDYEYSGRDDIREIIIPENIKKIGKNAFYNCHNLEKITLSGELKDISFDIFINCNKLETIVIKCDETLKSGIIHLLPGINSTISLIYTGEEREYARLLFIDFYDYYDEITPAHVFGRNIEGEGFRQRQCFRDERPDFTSYDDTFKRVCQEEKREVAGRMAAWRLITPMELSDDARSTYKSYLLENGRSFIFELVHERDKCTLENMFELGLISEEDALDAIKIASSEMEWSEGVSFLMSMKNKHFSGKKRNRYVFR